MIEKDRVNFRGGGMDAGAGSDFGGFSGGDNSPAAGGNTGGTTGGNTGGNTGGGNDYTGADYGFEVTRQNELANLVNQNDNDPFEIFRNQQLGDIPITGIATLGLNALKGPFQHGMTYNRNFFLENVLPSGKMLTTEQFSNLSPSQQEALYSDYMQARLSGQTDAYGNPLPQSDGDSNPLQNILLAQQAAQQPQENLQGGVAQLYNQYLQNLGYGL